MGVVDLYLRTRQGREAYLDPYSDGNSKLDCSVLDIARQAQYLSHLEDSIVRGPLHANKKTILI